MVADDLALCVAKTSAAMVLTLNNKLVLVFQGDAPSQCSDVINNANMHLMFAQKNSEISNQVWSHPHLLTSEQVTPTHSDVQLQRKPFTKSVHSPRSPHGDDAHSLMLFSQFGPELKANSMDYEHPFHNRHTSTFQVPVPYISICGRQNWPSLSRLMVLSRQQSQWCL